MNEEILKVEGLHKTFSDGSTVAVDHVSFGVGPGEILGVLGPSGCGKTTTLRMIAGLERPNSGSIYVNGADVTALPANRRNIGLVFQDLAIFPHMRVFDNVAFGMRMKKAPKSLIRKEVAEILALLELPIDEFGHRSPETLSGGQRQRVALARSLIVKPTLVLFDEPMVSLDRRLRDRMIIEIRQLLKRLGIAAVYVTHDQESVSAIADRVAVMNGGHIEQVGAPFEIYMRPTTRFIADFVGDVNILPLSVQPRTSREPVAYLGALRLDLDSTKVGASEQLYGAIRPESIVISRSKNESLTEFARGTVLSSHFSNGHQMLRVSVAGDLADTVLVRVSGAEAALTEGTSVWLHVEARNICVLN